MRIRARLDNYASATVPSKRFAALLVLWVFQLHCEPYIPLGGVSQRTRGLVYDATDIKFD